MELTSIANILDSAGLVGGGAKASVTGLAFPDSANVARFDAAMGALFSTRSKEVQKRERLFLIKPKLISVPINYSAVASGSGVGPDRVR